MKIYTFLIVQLHLTLVADDKKSSNDVFDNFNNLDIYEGGSEDERLLRTNDIESGSLQGVLLPQLGQEVSCNGVFCENNASCAVLDGTAMCMCPLGTAGTYCQKGNITFTFVYIV